jgi:transposase
MSRRHYTPEFRDAAVAEYRNTGDSISIVATRLGISRCALTDWISAADGPELAYVGGWEVRGGIKVPLFPERRSA